MEDKEVSITLENGKEVSFVLSCKECGFTPCQCPAEKYSRGICVFCDTPIYKGEPCTFLGDKQWHDECDPEHVGISSTVEHAECLCESCQAKEVKELSAPKFFICPDCKFYHDDTYYGDCVKEQAEKNFSNSFTKVELDKTYGAIGWSESSWDTTGQISDTPSTSAYKTAADYASGGKQTGFSYGGGTTFPAKKMCYHYPTKVIEGKTGWNVYAGARWDVKGKAARYPLVLNLSGMSIAPEHHIPVPELKKWETERGNTEIMLDWPDQGIVDFPIQFWLDIRDYIKKKKIDMLVFCVGGHGRTGTAVACLLITIGMTSDDAIKWVRKNYCSEAIENKWQEEYVHDMYKEYQELRGKKGKKQNA